MGAGAFFSRRRRGSFLDGEPKTKVANLSKRVLVLMTVGSCLAAGVPTSVAAPAAGCLGAPATIVGSAGKDRIVGTKKADVIAGLGGNDTIFGKGGNDTICGGDGNDNLLGELGNDTVSGDAGKDVANFKTSKTPVTADLAAGGATGEGTDSLQGLESITGSNQSDTLRGDGSDNALTGLSGDDTLDGGAGNDVQKSGPGNDRIDGGDGTDSHYGGPGDDRMDGGPGSDAAAFKFSSAPVDANLATGTASGEGADQFVNMDILVGSAYADTLSGSDLGDAFYPLGGDDVVRGMGGQDQVIYAQSPAGVTVDLGAASASGGEGNDRLESIEIAVGSRYNDALTGDGGSNALHGLDGDDVLDGADGTDFLNGGNGNDSCINGEQLNGCDP